LAFLADGVDTNGPAAFAEVFFPGGSYGRAVNGVGVGSTPTVVLFNQYPNVTALQLYGITDPGGIAWDDFEFHFEYWTPYWWDLESHPGGMAPDLAYPGGSIGEWEWGVATYPPEVAAHSGQKVWGTDLDGSAYDGSPNSHVLRWQDVTLDGQPGAPWSLEWWDWYGGDGFLDGRVVKVDDGSSTTDVFEGTDDQRLWQRHEISLAPWAGQTVDILFVLGTCCGTTPSDGWYLDDVKITDASFVFVDGFEDGSTSAWQ
jgi:hypothetical protein